MSRRSSDEFTQRQIREALRVNAAEVRARWPGDFAGKPDHYRCEHCAFVSDDRRFFQIDHVQPVARGGSRDRVTPAQQAGLDAGDAGLLYTLGVNLMVLCVGCNQGKKAKEAIPKGCGYACTQPAWDRNPDHIYQGPPTDV